MAALAVAALAAASPARAGEARFAWFEYSGKDGAPVAAGQYRNPVLAGFHPDPSMTHVGDDFYLVTSTFAWFPGIPVFHSRDLVNWRVGSSRVDLQACKLEYSIVSPK